MALSLESSQSLNTCQQFLMKVTFSFAASFSLGGSEVAAQGSLSVSPRGQTVQEAGDVRTKRGKGENI